MNNEEPFIIIKNHRKRQPLAEITSLEDKSFKNNILSTPKIFKASPLDMDKQNYDLFLFEGDPMKKLPSPHQTQLINYS